MKLKDMLDVLHTQLHLSSSEEVKAACEQIVKSQDMSGGEVDTLLAAYKNGPLWDGDVPSKSGRDSLVRAGFLAKVVVKGESGYNACTYKGADIARLIFARIEERKK